MNVLMIDDESVMIDAISERLDDLSRQGEIIGSLGEYPANNFFQAREDLEKRIPFDLIITDLLMPSRGLGNIPDREPGITLNGWIFLYHYILKEDAPYYQDCRETKIIIFSGYREVLQEYLIEKNLIHYWREKRFTFVDKGHIYNDTGGFDALMRTVKQLLQP